MGKGIGGGLAMKNALTDFNARNADENTIQAMFAEIAATVLSGGYFQVNESTRIYPMNGLDSNSLHSVIISFSCLIVGRIVFFYHFRPLSGKNALKGGNLPPFYYICVKYRI